MKVIIKNRYTEEIKIEVEAESLKKAVEENKANLWGADLREANLGEADLREANLGGANLWGADLREANLGGANLGGANLWGADLRGAKIKITQKEDLIKSLGIKIGE